MNIIVKEANIVVAYVDEINIDDLRRSEIKEILQGQSEEPPHYLELPNPRVAVFDYKFNPIFPVHLQFGQKRQLFVLNGNANLDLNEDDSYVDFVEKAKLLNALSYLSDLNKKAFGINFIFSVTSSSQGEQLFQNIVTSEINFSENSNVVAQGYRRIETNQEGTERIDFRLMPNISGDIDQVLISSFEININIHSQTPGSNIEDIDNCIDAIVTEKNRWITKIEEL